MLSGVPAPSVVLFFLLSVEQFSSSPLPTIHHPNKGGGFG